MTWKSLKRSITAVFVKSKDITSMEVKRPRIHTVTLKSSSTLLNVDLSNCMAYITNAKPPAPPAAIVAHMASDAQIPINAMLKNTDSETTASRTPDLANSFCSAKSATSSTLLSTTPNLSTSATASTYSKDLTNSTCRTANYSHSVQTVDPAYNSGDEAIQLTKRQRRSFHHNMAAYCKNKSSLNSLRITFGPRYPKNRFVKSLYSDDTDGIETIAKEYQEYLTATSESLERVSSFNEFLFFWEPSLKVEVAENDSEAKLDCISPVLCAVPNPEVSAVQPRKNRSRKMRTSHVPQMLARRFSMSAKDR